MGDHDHSYKLLFAHARMVRDLLEAFVGGDWLTQVDFDTLERVSDSYISDDLRARADDIVWRIRCGSRHVYLLIEFQSRVDPFMAVRVLAYVALLYQDLIRARGGRSRRRVARSFASRTTQRFDTLVRSGGSAFTSAARTAGTGDIPARRCAICRSTKRSYDDAALARHDNLVASLFRLEQCRQLDRVERLVSHLVGQLKGTAQESLCRAFAVWLDKVILKRLSGECTTLSDLWEKQTMLSERFDEWEAQFLREGRQQGIREGEASLLTRQLRKRFGELPESVRARVREAGPDQLEHWGERLLEVSSLDELFIEEHPSLV